MIKVKNIVKNYGTRNVNDDISFEIKQGEFVSLMGSSGSGKSTLLNIVSGLLDPTNGTVEIDGTNIHELKKSKRVKFRSKNISFIFQNYSLIEYMTVEQNLLFIAKNNKVKVSKEELNNISSRLGLTEVMKTKASDISGGQKQRVAIGRAILNKSKIIVADEPTGALDLASRDSVITILKEVAKESGTTIFCVTHDPFVASKSDRTMFLLNGKISKISEGETTENISSMLIELEKGGSNA